jgi:hypothetical protein
MNCAYSETKAQEITPILAPSPFFYELHGDEHFIFAEVVADCFIVRAHKTPILCVNMSSKCIK